VGGALPESDPYRCGLLDVGDGNRVYGEVRGRPAGRPVLIVHGGPGSGRPGNAQKLFNHDVFRIVLFDQRGCGNSVPSAADPSADVTHNTTEHLLADMEALREHLGVKRWLLYGGSWASTLILAYAERHPDRVSGIILVGVTMTRPREIDWLYHGLRLLLPIDWERFRAGAAAQERDGNFVEAYRRLMEHPDLAVREQDARDWCVGRTPRSPMRLWATPASTAPSLTRRSWPSFASAPLLCAQCLVSRRADTAKCTEAQRNSWHHHSRALRFVRAIVTAWELVQAWPDAELKVIEDSGHTGSPVNGHRGLRARAPSDSGRLWVSGWGRILLPDSRLRPTLRGAPHISRLCAQPARSPQQPLKHLLFVDSDRESTRIAACSPDEGAPEFPVAQGMTGPFPESSRTAKR
jgi:proline iminopeptidase